MKKKNIKVTSSAKSRSGHIHHNPVQKVVKDLLNAVLLVVFLSSIALMYFSYTYIETYVSGPSMMPTLNANYNEEPDNMDTVYINRFKEGERGDIIVSRLAEDNKYVIKRLIAVGGDSLRIELNAESTNPAEDYLSIYVNDELVQENYDIYTDYETGISQTLLNWEAYRLLDLEKPVNERLFDGFTLNIPEGHVFYLGDNRDNSTDCSSYGPVSEDHVVGKVDIVVEYGSSLQEYFWDEILELVD